MGRVGYNPKKGRIKTDAFVTIDRGFIAHLKIAAAAAPALSANAVLALTNMGAAAQAITAGITNPAVSRALSIVSNKSNAAGNVVITGRNYAGEAITETLALNGVTTRNGAKAFRDVLSVSLPVQTNTPVAQVETATVVADVSEGGDAAVTVASALFEENVVLAVAVETGDDQDDVAAAIRAAMEADPVISAHFDVSGENAAVILTAKLPAANDATLNIAIATGTATGVTTAATSANTTAGVDYDKVSVGFNDILGLPYLLAHNTVLAAALNNVRETNAPTVTVSATTLESNTVKLHSALAGQVVDVYLIA